MGNISHRRATEVAKKMSIKLTGVEQQRSVIGDIDRVANLSAQPMRKVAAAPAVSDTSTACEDKIIIETKGHQRFAADTNGNKFKRSKIGNGAAQT